MFIRPNDNPVPYFSSDLYMKIGLLLPALGIIVVGFYSPIYEHINDLVALFLGK